MAEATPNPATPDAKAPVIPAGGVQPTPTPAPTILTDSAASGGGAAPLTPEPKAPEKTGAPEQYALKLPDGSLLDAKAVEGIASFAKEQGLSQTQAEKLLLREHEAVARFVEGQNESLNTSTKQWVEQVQNDSELGGVELPKNVETAKRAIMVFGSEELKKQLNESGLGNHPEFVRFCYRVGKAMANDSFERGGSGTSSKKDMAEVFYGKSEVAAN